MRWLVALMLAGCTLQPAPVTPPPDGPGSCETAAERLASLGWCGVEPAGWVERCRDEERTQAAQIARLPVGCLSASESCEEAWGCK